MDQHDPKGLAGGLDGCRRAFPAARGHLDAATYGLPPTSAVEALREGLQRWRRGLARPIEYDHAVTAARERFAHLVAADPADVAVANQVSVLVGLVAAALPDGARVLLPEQEFTSLLFPFLTHADRGVTVRTVPLADLAAAVDADTDLVAFSVVQSADGRVADVDAVADAAAGVGAQTLADATQAAGWLPVDAGRVDYLVAAAYKWLLSPRGSAFLVARAEQRGRLRPLLAGWYAGEDPWRSIYGGPLRLATSARRFDVSPAWLTWLGTAPALEALAGFGVARIHRHNVALANALRDRLELPRSDSAVVSVADGDVEALAGAGVTASARSGSVRLAFHLYNDHDDVDAAAAALAGAAQQAAAPLTAVPPAPTPEEVVEQLYAARGRGDRAAIRALLDDDVVWREPHGEAGYTGVHHGADAVLDDMLGSALAVTGGTFRVELDRTLAHGDLVAATVTWSATRGETTMVGRELASYRVRDGRVVEAQFMLEDPEGTDAFFR